MDKVSARQALSQAINGKTIIKKKSFKKSIEPETGYRRNRQMLRKTEKGQLIRRNDHTNPSSKKRKVCSMVD